ncbi:unnamed protein product [Pleuronectes platessa]|uniref:Uncharacterized protein n=1 Tax=Pleuronectes platessa TaxID=8262 RepID=A0A9N7VLW8_PLEPL|nr:unnamed protein product [Pleuronectes platessa]
MSGKHLRAAALQPEEVVVWRHVCLQTEPQPSQAHPSPFPLSLSARLHHQLSLNQFNYPVQQRTRTRLPVCETCQGLSTPSLYTTGSSFINKNLNIRECKHKLLLNSVIDQQHPTTSQHKTTASVVGCRGKKRLKPHSLTRSKRKEVHVVHQDDHQGQYQSGDGDNVEERRPRISRAAQRDFTQGLSPLMKTTLSLGLSLRAQRRPALLSSVHTSLVRSSTETDVQPWGKLISYYMTLLSNPLPNFLYLTRQNTPLSPPPFTNHPSAPAPITPVLNLRCYSPAVSPWLPESTIPLAGFPPPRAQMPGTEPSAGLQTDRGMKKEGGRRERRRRR